MQSCCDTLAVSTLLSLVCAVLLLFVILSVYHL